MQPLSLSTAWSYRFGEIGLVCNRISAWSPTAIRKHFTSKKNLSKKSQDSLHVDISPVGLVSRPSKGLSLRPHFCLDFDWHAELENFFDKENCLRLAPPRALNEWITDALGGKILAFLGATERKLLAPPLWIEYAIELSRDDSLDLKIRDREKIVFRVAKWPLCWSAQFALFAISFDYCKGEYVGVFKVDTVIYTVLLRLSFQPPY